MSSDWTHRACERCWFDGPNGQLPGGGFRLPNQLIDPDPGACCFCGGLTITGIFVRADPNHDTVMCGGDHDELRWARVETYET